MNKYLYTLFTLFSCFILSAFSLRMPFQSSDALDKISDETLVAVGITHVTTGDNAEKNDIFWEHTYAVIDSLPTHKGYLGHKVRQQIFGNQGWTMTIWQDDESLMKFVKGDKHQNAIDNGLDAVAKARFVNFTIERSKIPLSWSDAEKIMNTKGRDWY